jgi:hypothetical protein
MILIGRSMPRERVAAMAMTMIRITTPPSTPRTNICRTGSITTELGMPT